MIDGSLHFEADDQVYAVFALRSRSVGELYPGYLFPFAPASQHVGHDIVSYYLAMYGCAEQ
jgi:hypothetical protein